MRIGIFGGSFDPVHNGHLILAEQIREEAKLDEVIFIPTYLSPFKTATKPTDGYVRLEMLRAAFCGNPYFKTSDIEQKREGASYTIDTLEYLRDQYPEDTEICFIMGTDAFMGLEKWRRAEDLLRNFTFLVGHRKGYSEEALFTKAAELKEKYDAKISVFLIPELEISSSDLRLRLQAGRSVKYTVPESVLEYIYEHHLYSDLLKELEEFAEKHQNPHRLAHTKGVVAYAEMYAKKYGADPFKAKVAAWFHDNYKEAGPLQHGPVAAEEIKKQFGISDPDIINAIHYHTTSRPGMSLLEIAVKMADLLEPGRTYPDAEILRNSVTDDPYETLLMLLKHAKEHILSRGEHFDDLSNQAIEYLEEKLNK